MELSPEEQAMRERIEAYAREKGFAINPDEEMANRVIKGLVKLKEAKGEAYCPCRLVTGKPDLDQAIICPCKYHEQEIAEQGMCHCRLLVAGNDGNA